MKKPAFLNIKGVVILIALITVGDLAFAFGLSPLVTRAAMALANKNIDPEVSIKSVRIHPALLSFSAREIEIRDPNDSTERMFYARSLSARLDPLAFLHKRIALSSLVFSGVQIEVTRDANGVMNVEKLAQTDKDKEPFWKRLKLEGKKDWFGTVYEKIKAGAKKKKAEPEKEEAVKAKARELPHGRVIEFSAPRSEKFRIKKLRFKEGKVVLTEDGKPLPPLENIDIDARGFRILQNGAAELNSLSIKGNLKTERDGRIDLRYKKKRQARFADIRLKDVDLAVLRPVYEDSLPVSFNRGFITLNSKNRLEPKVLESDNHLKIDAYEITAGTSYTPAGLTGKVIAEALNKKEEFELRFKIGGTPAKPSFSGFLASLHEIVKDEIANIQGGSGAVLKEKAGEEFDKLKDKMKSLFNNGE